MADPTQAPHPDLTAVFRALSAYQITNALKAALELEVFTHVAAGATTAAEIAKLSQASEKGMRVLCDYLTVQGLLTKQDGKYGLAAETGIFLDKASPAYMGSIAGFLAHPSLMGHFSDITALVRKGGSLGQGTLAPNDPVWVDFARNMAPPMAIAAQIIAPHITTPGQPAKILDIAAGHGMFGIFAGKHNPAATIVGLDWENVLAVAKENAQKMGIGDRYQTIAGSAFDVDFGTGYDAVLLPNFLHHFDPPTNVKLLKKIRAAMKPDAVLATAEFVPNEDRVSPPMPATFSLMMLGSTAGGDAYTFAEFDKMFRDAGFGKTEAISLAPSPSTLLLTRM